MGPLRVARWVVRGLGAELVGNLVGRRAGRLASVVEDRGTAVITGATGGLGAATARSLARHGFDVALGARDLDKAAAVAAAIERDGGRARCVLVDLGTPASSVASARRVAATRPSVLVNNAGVMGGGKRATWAVNFLHTALFTLAVLPALRGTPRQAPRVVNVASSSHLRAPACVGLGVCDDNEARDSTLATYAASKLSLMHFSEALRALDAQRNQRDARMRTLVVHDVHPGLVWTPMLRQHLFGTPRRRSTTTKGCTMGLFITPVRRRLFKDPEVAAETVVNAVMDAALAPRSSDRHDFKRADFQTYYVDGQPKPHLASPESRDPAGVRHTWNNALRPTLLQTDLRDARGRSFHPLVRDMDAALDWKPPRASLINVLNKSKTG